MDKLPSRRHVASAPLNPVQPTTIGRLIAWLREQRGWSQAALAARLVEQSGNSGATQDHISRWEGEHRIPSPYWRQHLATVFGLPVDVMSQAAKAAQAARQERRMPSSPPRHMAVSPSGAPTVDVAAIVAVSARESARLGEYVDNTPFSAYTVEEVVGELRRLAAVYPYSSPVDSLLAARALRDRAYELASQSRRPSYTRDLYLVTAWSCAILANASFDLGAVHPAGVHARTALHFGDLCEHRGVQVWVRGLQALMAFWDGRPREAVSIVEPVLERPTEHGTAEVRAHAIYARALARLGRAHEADQALARTDSARERVRHAASTLDDPGGMADYPLAKQLYWQANTHLHLEGPDRLRAAHRAAEESIRLYLTAPAGQQRIGELCHARLDLAAARWRQGHPEGAEQEVSAVTDTLRQRYVESVVRRMDDLGQLVSAQVPDSGLAQRVLTQITAVHTIAPPLADEVPVLPIAE
ncbi:helix-turn-helix transcriptional regulator [Planomonospora sp. ID91781]|uniref:helix-turn-helix domain-containing protein n=1 Tax=Planomonospora sp. ID91781 TaxID=2738135 RepID=UPI0018C35441|nr:helix-turn-helix transcriptional regulator [Planomonospora sp. ID91781]MBG0825694.1 helix-turn-helix transcriptional regulator [Planomonospora sp. ID91781]